MRKKPLVHLAISSLLTVIPLASCVTVRESDGAPSYAPPPLFGWPEFQEEDRGFLHTGVYHNVQLLVEIDFNEDIPAGKELRNYIIPDLEGNQEVYRVLDLHEVIFAHGAFEVGGYRYTAPVARGRRGGAGTGAKEGATLHVLKERQGPLTFLFRGEPIVVEGRGWWKPSVYYYRQRGQDADGPWMRETVEVGLSKIETSSRSAAWQVDGSPYRPETQDRLVLRGALRFEGR